MLEKLVAYYDYGIEYKESKQFKKLIEETILEIASNGSHKKILIKTIKEDFLYTLFGDPITHGDTYTFMRYCLLPSIQKDRMNILKRLESKLMTLASLYIEGKQYVKAHIITTIVKRHLVEMYKGWVCTSVVNIVKNVFKCKYS